MRGLGCISKFLEGGPCRKLIYPSPLAPVRSILVSVSGWHRRLTDPGPLSSRSNAGRPGRAKRPRDERGGGASFLADLVKRGARLRGGKWKSIVFFRSAVGRCTCVLRRGEVQASAHTHARGGHTDGHAHEGRRGSQTQFHFVPPPGLPCMPPKRP